MYLPSDGDTETAAESGVRLTQQVKAGGCASKLSPGALSSVLSRLPRQQHPDLLVGFDTADDAGVFRIAPETALVQTVDFFTPMVDDPYTFGRIAANNALSDVYAMGGRALTALTLVCFPADGDLGVLEQIMRGGLATMKEANCVVVGGHSVRDVEIKFGYAVTGLVNPDALKTNAGARAGDSLILTKAIGTGVITTALKDGKARKAWVNAAVKSMTMSNRSAAEIASSVGAAVHGMTDVTGFGLAGHAREMAIASDVRVVIDTGAVRILEGARECIEMDCVPAGLRANREFAECFVKDMPRAGISEMVRMVLFDPQTAGGLLIAVDPSQALRLLKKLQAAGYPATEIGSVVEGEPRIVLC
ncbi:MAG TPA: selenide, water dikinase SelD [Silvibacterium sp.]|nr:selenide, water dikinase SelD [Silvibacterium sp.]